ncbi:MAG: hypothetical protein IH991_13295 [Planctomycetes bacterium]|nr:hypothetical protein [Planctomycetota bacterium]
MRVSSREAYVAPDRGDQGNALKTVVAMPFVIDGERGQVTINSQGVRHEITLAIDHIRQTPVITHDKHQDDRFVKNGTSVTVELPRSFFDDEGQDLQESDYDGDEDLPRSLLSPKERFLQIADDFTFLNPHVSLTCDWYGERIEGQATNAEWSKWRPSDPTSAHWYTDEHLARLVSAHLSHGKYSTVRELVADFRGLSSTAKQKRVLATAGLTRAPLEGLINGDGKSLDRPLLEKLLSAMREESKPVKPAALGVIGREHLETKFESLGCEMESFNYKKVAGDTDGIPWIVETAFGWCDDAKRRRRIVTGVNWSPGIINPFRELGTYGRSLDTVLSQQRATAEEPIVFLLHMACPRVQFADRGKSSVIVEN